MNPDKLKNFYPWAFFNLLLLSVAGLVLRYMHLFSAPHLEYQFILHGHSHFAFSGWMFLSLALLMIRQFSDSSNGAAYRKILMLTIFCSFGMLVSFSMQGYKFISIIFSTLFLLISCWFGYLMYREPSLKRAENHLSARFIVGSIIFLFISCAGPLALGPIQATGHKGSVLFQDAIYFYLHFQLNGWMQLAVLGLLMSTHLKAPPVTSGLRVHLNLFIFSTIPLYFIFLLWTEPPLWIRAIAFAAALIHACGWFALMIRLKNKTGTMSLLVRAALMAISIKVLLQVMICFPSIGQWVFSSRNIIIGYIHLITLGIVTPLILDQFIVRGILKNGMTIKYFNVSYLMGVITYLILLFIQPLAGLFEITIPHFELILFILSGVLVLITALYFWKAGKPHTQLVEIPLASAAQ